MTWDRIDGTSNNRGSLFGTLRFVVASLQLLLWIGGVAAAQNPVPLINQPLVPDAIRPGAAGFTLTVNGTGFVSGAVVKWNGGTRTTTFVSKSRLTASIPSTDVAKAGTASVIVVNPVPGGGRSNVVFFDITKPTPSIFMAPSLSLSTGSGGTGPDAIAIADFNADHKLDLAAVNDLTSSVSIILGNGDGTFQPAVSYATDAFPDSVVVGDFNGDGTLDIAVRSQYSYTISVLLGNGDGTFQPFLTTPTTACGGRLAAGDFNGDGKLDLACTSSNDVAILLGNGDGTFQNELDHGAISGANAIAVGDVNRDAKLDLAITGSTGISILLGNGDGTFQPPVEYATGGKPSDSVDVADLNGDGILDLIVPNQNNTVSVLLGNGDGTFQSYVDYPARTDVGRSTVADMNGDGKLDLIVTPRDSSNIVSVLLGNGNGTFGPAVTFAAGSAPLGVAAGDFNGDGRLDLAVADNGGSSVSVLLQSSAYLAKTSVQFAAQLLNTNSIAQSVTLTNLGPTALSISSIAVKGTNQTDFSENNTCGSGVAPGASCKISSDFHPTAVGVRTALIAITDSAVDSPQKITLNGTGVISGPDATLSATSLTFATQLLGTTSAAKTVTLTNYGTASLSISSIAASGDFNPANVCGLGLAPLSNCTISTTFSPTMIGSRTGVLSILDDAPGSPQTVKLKGTATEVEINPSSLSFVVHRGNVGSQTITLTNVGGTALSITSMTISGGPFSQTNTCGSSVAAGGSCAITVSFFAPMQTGQYTGDLLIYDNGGASPQSIPLKGTSFCRWYFGHCY